MSNLKSQIILVITFCLLVSSSAFAREKTCLDTYKRLAKNERIHPSYWRKERSVMLGAGSYMVVGLFLPKLIIASSLGLLWGAAIAPAVVILGTPMLIEELGDKKWSNMVHLIEDSHKTVTNLEEPSHRLVKFAKKISKLTDKEVSAEELANEIAQSDLDGSLCEYGEPISEKQLKKLISSGQWDL